MKQYVPDAGEQFAFFVDSQAGVRPAAAFGTLVTPAQNASTGAFAEVLTAAQVSEDLYGLLISFQNGATSGQGRDITASVSFDPTGVHSTSTIRIPGLLCSAAAPLDSTGTANGGVLYYFPIWVRAGSSIAVRASVNNATVGVVRCWIRGYGRPRNPRAVKVGTYVVAYGRNEALSRGTVVVPGQAAEGAWTLLGTVAAPDQPWWWQVGFGLQQSTTSQLLYFEDLGLGDGTNMIVPVSDMRVITSTSEQVSHSGYLHSCEAQVPAGTGVYARMQCSGVPDITISAIGYGLCG